MESRLFAAALVMCAGLAARPPDVCAQPRVRIDGVITSLGFDQGGKWLAVGFRDAEGVGRVRLYSMKRRADEHVDLPSMSKPVTMAAFLDGDKYLAIADEGSELVVWSWPDLGEVFRVNLAKKQGQPGSRFYVVGNPRGPHVAWVEVLASEKRGAVEVASLPRGEVITRFDKVGIEHQVAWSEGGDHLLLGGAVWNWDTLKSWSPNEPGVTGVSEDGAHAASAPPVKCDGISIADLRGNKILRTIPTDDAACPRFIWFVDGGKAVVWLGAETNGDGLSGAILYRWNAKKDRVRVVKKNLPAANIAVLAPGGREIAIADARRVRFVKLR